MNGKPFSAYPPENPCRGLCNYYLFDLNKMSAKRSIHLICVVCLTLANYVLKTMYQTMLSSFDCVESEHFPWLKMMLMLNPLLQRLEHDYILVFFSLENLSRKSIWPTKNVILMNSVDDENMNFIDLMISGCADDRKFTFTYTKCTHTQNYINKHSIGEKEKKKQQKIVQQFRHGKTEISSSKFTEHSRPFNLFVNYEFESLASIKFGCVCMYVGMFLFETKIRKTKAKHREKSTEKNVEFMHSNSITECRQFRNDEILFFFRFFLFLFVFIHLFAFLIYFFFVFSVRLDCCHIHKTQCEIRGNCFSRRILIRHFFTLSFCFFCGATFRNTKHTK